MKSVRQLDEVFSALVIALGVAQSLATPLIFPRVEEPAAWFLAGGLGLALVGAVSFLRIRHDSSADLWRLSVAASSITAVFWLLLAYFLTYKFVRYPAAFGALAIICVHAAIAVVRSIHAKRGLTLHSS